MTIFSILLFSLFIINVTLFLYQPKSQVSKSAVTPSPHQSQATVKPQTIVMSNPIMSTPAAFKSPTAAESAALSQQNSPAIERMSSLEDTKVLENQSSPPMMMPPPTTSANAVSSISAPVSETKKSIDLTSPSERNLSANVIASPDPSVSNGGEIMKTNDQGEKDKQDGSKGIESNTEAAASALLIMRH